MKISVIGCGRWGSFITWYLDKTGHEVSLYGRKDSSNMQRFLNTRQNDLLSLPLSVNLTTELSDIDSSEIIVISINSQGLRNLFKEINSCVRLKNKIIVLCMKGLEVDTGKRLSEIACEELDTSNKVAVWLGPGHVQEFYAGKPNCMVIDSEDEDIKEKIINEFSSDTIRFYYGEDLIGNEIGAAAKNVIGIAAGMLDGMNLTALKGALISRGTREISVLIKKLGGNELSAYGLCHLGDYEATVFSKHSHNRQFGESFIKNEPYSSLAEGYYTVKPLVMFGKNHGVDLPICNCIYDILYNKGDVTQEINKLFSRKLKKEFEI